MRDDLPDIARVRLHRASSGPGWRIADTALMLTRTRGSWKVRYASGVLDSWCARHSDLLAEVFATRAEALRCVEAVIRDDPPVSFASRSVPLVRVSDEQRATKDGRYLVTRERSGWAVRNLSGECYTICNTLRTAASYLGVIYAFEERAASPAPTIARE